MVDAKTYGVNYNPLTDSATNPLPVVDHDCDSLCNPAPLNQKICSLCNAGVNVSVYAACENCYSRVSANFWQFSIRVSNAQLTKANLLVSGDVFTNLDLLLRIDAGWSYENELVLNPAIPLGPGFAISLGPFALPRLGLFAQLSFPYALEIAGYFHATAGLEQS